ncbi:MAG: hypothetical protein V4672_03915 [Verrucomicrobiota bacterium]
MMLTLAACFQAVLTSGNLAPPSAGFRLAGMLVIVGVFFDEVAAAVCSICFSQEAEQTAMSAAKARSMD